jgi:hypothetical protein
MRAGILERTLAQGRSPCMAINVPNIAAAAAAGTLNAANAAHRSSASRDATQRPGPLRRDEDRALFSVQPDAAVRGLAGNEQEDARGDHQEHPSYTPEGRAEQNAQPTEHTPIDLEG